MLLQVFTDLTISNSLLFSTIFISILFASIKIKSPISIMLWVFLVASIIGVLELDMDIMVFWSILFLNAIGLGVSIIVYTFSGQNV